MKTDSLFYRIFQTAPGIVLELAGVSPSKAIGYEFRSVELKQTTFRIDGVLIPTQNNLNQPTYFVEVQFQPDPQLYHRFFAELFLYLAQNPNTADWRGILVYPSRRIRPQQTPLHQLLIESAKVQEIYLDELGDIRNLPLGISLLKLIVEPEETAIVAARSLSTRPMSSLEFSHSEFLDLIGTILLYKLNLNREEVITMLAIDDIKQSRFYHDVSVEKQREILTQLFNDRFSDPVTSEAIAERSKVLDRLSQLDNQCFVKLIVALSKENRKSLLTETLKTRFGTIPDPIITKIEQATNATQENWIWLALTVESIEEFATAIGIENDSSIGSTN